MNGHLKTLLIGAIVAVLALPLMSVKMERVSLAPQTTQEQGLTALQSTPSANTQTPAPSATPMFTLMIPVLTGPSEAAAVCDPSEGRHSGLFLMCYLMWLMEVTDASTGF